MKIAVCVKQVPDSETRINLPGPVPQLDTASFTMVINPYDQFAVEEAVLTKEKLPDTEITVVTVGPEAGVREMIKKDCLAVGCDEAVIVDDAALAGADLRAANLRAADLLFNGRPVMRLDAQGSGLASAMCDRLCRLIRGRASRTVGYEAEPRN